MPTHEKPQTNKSVDPLHAPHTWLSRLIRNGILLLWLPVDFLLVFGDPLDPVAELREPNEKAYKLGHHLLEQIQGHASGGMRVYFIGSTFFEIAGVDNDIDFLVEYQTEAERARWRKVLVSMFGDPVLEKRSFTKWECTREGIPVEVVLDHPTSRIFRKIFDSYEALRTDPELRAQYEELKRNSVGVSLREYNWRQLYFFEYYAKRKLARNT